jgi:hypothetical protein
MTFGLPLRALSPLPKRLRVLHRRADRVICTPRSRPRQFPFGTNRLHRCKALTFLRFLAVPSSSCRTDAVTLAESRQPENAPAHLWITWIS